MKLRQLIIAAFTLSSAVAFAHGTAAKTTSDNSGANITQVQQALNDKGFDAGPVDGKAGPKTKAALKQFQQSQGISASGQLDGKTIVALGVGSTSSTQSSSDTQGSASTQGNSSSSSSQASDTSMSSSPTTSQSTSSIGSSQPPSSAPSDQASNQQSSSASTQSSTSKY